jgi:hypothetical protein
MRTPAAAAMTGGPACRLCFEPLRSVLVDLGTTPLANAYLRPEQFDGEEPSYPLRAYVCERCFLVQLETVVAPEAIFSEYAYFSSYSSTLLARSQAYADAVIEQIGLGTGDRVIEIASNDGYLLQFFHRRGIDVLGIEPAANIAAAAESQGIATLVRFFRSDLAAQLASEGRRARLVVANNVLAHVPDVHDFVEGLRLLVAPGGLVTVEFHHALNLITQVQFDNIYHEHLSYFSLTNARALLAAHRLAIVDVEEIRAQGGSLRVYARPQDDDPPPTPSPNVAAMLAKEEAAGLNDIATYSRFSEQVQRVKDGLLEFLHDARRGRRAVVGYGAAAKGNTLLNYCGISPDLLEAVVDRSSYKQGLLLPGSHIPIHDPDYVKVRRPAYLLILPWNIREEIMDQMSYILDWGARFVVAIPQLMFFP